jgi:ANTAR domain
LSTKQAKSVPEEEPSMKPSHGDPLVPEDHEEIKNEELMALEKEVDGLKTALGTRTLTGKAMGIIIEREGVNETEAFEKLKGMSQHTNVKLRDVAAEMARDAQPDGKEEP